MENQTRTSALNADRIIALNCGLGRDSLTMLALAAEGRLYVQGLGNLSLADLDYVCFSDTGAEWKHSYDLIPRVREMLEGSGCPLIVLRKPTELEPIGHHSSGRAKGRLDTWRVGSFDEIGEKALAGGYHYRLSIMDDYGSRTTVVGFGGDCTGHHKIGPMRRLMNDWSLLRFGKNNTQWGKLCKKGDAEKHVCLIGFAADEPKRIARAYQERAKESAPNFVTEEFPLVDMGIGKPQEQEHLARHGLGHVRKSGCDMCKFQPPSWWWALSVQNPDRYADIIAYEARAMARNPNMAVTGAKSNGHPLTLSEVVAKWRALNPGATVAGVLDKEYSHDIKEAKAAQGAELAGVPDVESVVPERRQLPLFAA